MISTKEVKRQLKKRLTHLEEETKRMKLEMLQNTAERKTLLKDLHRQLKLIQFSLHPENSLCKKPRGSHGLSQVLYEDLNPSVVTRGGSGTNLVAAQGPADNIKSSVLCIEDKN